MKILYTPNQMHLVGPHSYFADLTSKPYDIYLVYLLINNLIRLSSDIQLHLHI
jgi:hypothetical protein